MRTRCKICGITRLEDALQAVESGVDALGFVFYEPSPRYIDPVKADEIVRQLPPFVSSVGLFVNHGRDQVESILKTVRLDVLQFHGDEDDAFCRSFNKVYYKAIGVESAEALQQKMREYPGASALLLDTHDPVLKGGTGRSFDWRLVGAERPKPIILAGGLNPENVREAINLTHPYAVDVSGGVEASKGIKDAQLMKDFLREVYRDSKA
ncbi:phosphoribosylanthranilate isomerase [Hahella sp. CCB-MM4]|uniref:phosphoribosylanthranilate isomerase n=1 Tax=Hahella sp. (strain CCB-MM4) TaxID=1926491 RepID=UPI001FEF5AE8|nr:phosphoribosylanthranilate isomerase [Hahella sp. CCB-MM4]